MGIKDRFRERAAGSKKNMQSKKIGGSHGQEKQSVRTKQRPRLDHPVAPRLDAVPEGPELCAVQGASPPWGGGGGSKNRGLKKISSVAAIFFEPVFANFFEPYF